jgi:hypothetical protein
MDKVFIIHDIKHDRYDDTVRFFGVATTEDERDRISNLKPGATVTEIETDCYTEVEGFELTRGCPSW